MSLDAGGLAQMTFNPTFTGGLGVPGSGYASRGKGSHIKRLSVPPPPKISTIDESQAADIAPTPRTSRSHLLAGLRTAPKSATLPPASAPLDNRPRLGGLEQSRHADFNARVPQTATGTSFPRMNGPAQMYSLPEHVLAPPSIQIHQEDDEPMDAKLYAELMATNLYLTNQQRQLQQQLLSVTAAAQQFQGLSVNRPMSVGVQQHFQYPMNSMGLYGAQLQQGLQPVVTEVPNQPGLYSVYNPLTGQQSFMVDNSVLQQPQSNDSPPPAYQELASSPPPPTPTFFPHPTPPASEKIGSYLGNVRGPSPPKSSPSPPQDVTPLPPPSANAFRRGHKKSSSFANSIKTAPEAPKTGGPKSAGFPQTPLTGTFGPGQGRAGEHPARQPRGPPPIEELLAKPTAKFEGSKNFASRQRRTAVSNLVRAGIERRGNNGSGGSNTPASEGEFTFSVTSSDNDDLASEGLSSKPSLGSLRAQAVGVIGSERKDRSRERGSVDSYIASSVSSDEGTAVGGALVEVKVEEPQPTERRKTPMLVLSSAEKRKSTIL